MRRCTSRFVLLAAFLCPAALSAQNSAAPPILPADTAGAFSDRAAALLMNRARDARLKTDRSMRSYTAVVKSRIAAGMRMPMKDRTMFRQESAARVRWSRDEQSIVQMLAARVQHPGGVEAPNGMSGLGIDELFDPSRDRMYFGMAMFSDTTNEDEDFWIEHPLGDQAERHYRFRSGDTLTVRLQDGRVLRTVELIVLPRESNPHTVRGTLSVDAQSGALVQAAFRLARTVNILDDMAAIDEDDRKEIDKFPGFLKPMEFDISLMTVEYSLWEMKHWLPYNMRFEGMVRVGIAKFPASADLHYAMTEVVTDETATETESVAIARTTAEWAVPGVYKKYDSQHDGKKFIVITPVDTLSLLKSRELPPAIWENAPGFATQDELERLYDRVANIPVPGRISHDIPTHVGWGLGEPDMVRYNRVEALSVGVRGSAGLPFGVIGGTARIGFGDLHPNAEVSLRRESMKRTLQLRAYHELTTVDESRSALGLGNSLSSLLFGRDEGEYFRASGAALAWTPPENRRQTWDITGYAEYQNDVRRRTHIALPRAWNDSVFRPNIRADEATQFGAMLRFKPWWGTDALRAQGGLEVLLHAEDGDYRHARGRVTLRGAAPLVSGVRLGVEAGVGTSEGDVPRQRLYYLGGASTLRGYEPSTVYGTSMARGRLELARTASFGNLAVFSDWGWAGDRDGDITRAQQRLAVGAGVSLLDGLVRLDLGHGLWAPRGWRLDLHVDAIL